MLPWLTEPILTQMYVQQCYEYMNSLKLLQTEVERIEFATRGQASNKLWSALHNGRITSSMFGEILHRRASTDPNNLVKRVMGYGRKESAPSTTAAMGKR